MTLFWTFAVGMIVLALAFVALPLIRKKPVDSVDSNQLNLAVCKDQLEELEADLVSGNLEQAQYEASRHDIEKELLIDITDEDLQPTNVAEKSGKAGIIVALALVPAISIGMYSVIGSPGMIDPPKPTPTAQQQQGPHGQGGAEQVAKVEEMVSKLVERLKEEPNNPNGWMMLARSYEAMERIPEALKAYEQAEKLMPDDVDLLLTYAEAIVQSNGNNFNGKPSQMIHHAFEVNPDSPNVLWMVGIVEYRIGNFVKAFTHWDKARILIGESNPNAVVAIEGAMNDARSQIARAGGKVPTTGKPISAPVDDHAGHDHEPSTAGQEAVTVRVTLADSLRSKVNDNDRVFIFARAATGPKMPLAAVDALVSDLPATIELNDNMARMPQLKISGYAKIVVGARVSKSGGAMPQSGDLQGEILNITPGHKGTIEIVIDTVRP
ncbi:MAG: c-type cytochrome biogenesis protein CcmI [Candidatus Polarisedimenticolaceae bacterium]|nr:c-type cytochrome biogenesis protein CcmI [Candidatus Polarisedimenticolaceae bacterium]